MSSVKSWPFCLSVNVLMTGWHECSICTAISNVAVPYQIWLMKTLIFTAVAYSSTNSMDTFNLKHLLSYPLQQSSSVGRPPWPIHCVPWRSIPMSYASVLPHAVLWAYLLARGNNWRRNILQRWSNHTIRMSKEHVNGKWIDNVNLKSYSRDENKNKTKWKSYVVYINRYFQYIFT